MVSRAANHYLRIASILCLCLYTPYTPALYGKPSKQYQTHKKRKKKPSQFENVTVYLLSLGLGGCIIFYVAYNKNRGLNNTSPDSKQNVSKKKPQPKPPSTPPNISIQDPPTPEPPTTQSDHSSPSSPLLENEESTPSPQPVQNDDFPESEELTKLQKEIAEIKQKGGLTSDLNTKKERFKELIESSKPWKECDKISKEAGAQYDEEDVFLKEKSTEIINNYLSELNKGNKDNKADLNREFKTNYNKIKDYADTHNGLNEQYKAFKLFSNLIQESLYDDSSQVQNIGYKNLSFDDIITKFDNLYTQQHSKARRYLYTQIKSSMTRQQMVSFWLYDTLIKIYTKVEKKYENQNQKNNIRETSHKKAFWFKPDKNDENTKEFNQNVQNLITQAEEEILKELPNTLGEQYPDHKELITALLSKQESRWKEFITDSVKACFHIVSNEDPGLVIETDTKTHQGVTYDADDNDYYYRNDDDDSDDDDDDKKAEKYKAVGRTKNGAEFSYIVWPAIYSKKTGNKLSKTYAVFSNNI